jgi:DNA polymerase I-like protein with 3'-5' exonuclease and polymerase domains
MSRIVSLDIESSSLNPWSGDIISAAIAWRENGEMKTFFVRGENDIRDLLERLIETDSKLLVYNASFEQKWFTHKYPDLNVKWYCDVMRLVQQAGTSFDSGGLSVEIDGFGLKPAVTRILGKTESWTDDIYKWIQSNFDVKKSDVGKYLGFAPDELLKPYNEADSIYTLELFEFLTGYFKKVKFDWTADHDIYLGVVTELTDANLKGIPVDIAKLNAYIRAIDNEIQEMDAAFADRYSVEIEAVREQLRQKEQAKFKKKIVTEAPEFNTGSRQHLEMLFCGQLGLAPAFLSPTGSPSFKSAHMGTWGEPGDMLANRGKRIIIQKQAEALVRVSDKKGVWHPELKACGTVTGRFAGSSGSNYQGWSRSDKPFMESIVARPGKVLLEQDFVSGEPTIISAYTHDEVYMFHVFTGEGKTPYYDDNGLLWVNDPYIATMSVSGLGSKELKDVFYNHSFDGLSFSEAWLKDSEIVKNHPVIKKYRKINKMLALAMGYGLGAKKLVKQVKEQFNLDVTESQAKKVISGYWKMYSGVKQFAEKCGYRVQQSGALVNQFGYRITPSPHNAFNALIQSTLSGVVNWRLLLLREKCDWFLLVGVIHDSIVMEIPEDRVEEFHRISDEVDEEINQQLQWCVKVRTGRNVGKNFYEIK